MHISGYIFHERNLSTENMPVVIIMRMWFDLNLFHEVLVIIIGEEKRVEINFMPEHQEDWNVCTV